MPNHNFPSIPLTDMFPTRETPNPVADYLVNYCVQMPNGEHMIRNTLTNEWKAYSKTKSLIVNALMLEHAGLKSVGNVQFAIGRDAIKDYVTRDMPFIDDTIFLPGAPQFFVFGSRRLNVFNPKVIMAANADLLCATSDPLHAKLRDFLNIIYGGICSHPGHNLSVEELIGIANGRDPATLEFRVLMSWLAKIYQEIGICLQTNMWMCGALGGIGKGTLTRILRAIYGRYCGGANQAEVERGWTSWVEGLLICEIDEFDNTSALDWVKFIKRTTTNPIVTLARRNKGSYDVPNTTNYIFHDNSEDPIPLDEFNRRDFFIETTSDEAWLPRARDFNIYLDRHPEAIAAIAQGFAAVLSLIEVDEESIAIAPATKLRRENQQHWQNAVSTWLRLDPDYPRDIEQIGSLSFAYFDNWRKREMPDSPINNAKRWGKWMRKERHHMTVRDSGGYRYYTIPSSYYPKPSQPSDGKEQGNVVKIREALLRQ